MGSRQCHSVTLESPAKWNSLQNGYGRNTFTQSSFVSSIDNQLHNIRKTTAPPCNTPHGTYLYQLYSISVTKLLFKNIYKEGETDQEIIKWDFITKQYFVTLNHISLYFVLQLQQTQYLGAFHTTPEKSDSGIFNLKTHQMFYLYTTLKKLENAIVTGQWLCIQTTTWTGKSRDCRVVIVLEKLRFQISKLTSVFYASVLLLITNFVITLSK